MKFTITSASWLALILWSTSILAAQAERRFPVDPNTKWAVGARQKPADELKKEMAAGRILIIDVRNVDQFQKETPSRRDQHPAARAGGPSAKNRQGDVYRVYLRLRTIKLAGCEASPRDGFPEHGVLSDRQVERRRVSDRAGEEELNSAQKFCGYLRRTLTPPGEITVNALVI